MVEVMMVIMGMVVMKMMMVMMQMIKVMAMGMGMVGMVMVKLMGMWVEVPSPGHGYSPNIESVMTPPPTPVLPELGLPLTMSISGVSWLRGAMMSPQHSLGLAPPSSTSDPLGSQLPWLRKSTRGDNSCNLPQQFLGVLSPLSFPMLGEGGQPTTPVGSLGS